MMAGIAPTTCRAPNVNRLLTKSSTLTTSFCLFLLLSFLGHVLPCPATASGMDRGMVGAPKYLIVLPTDCQAARDQNAQRWLFIGEYYLFHSR